jgi:hypothetical protein
LAKILICKIILILVFNYNLVHTWLAKNLKHKIIIPANCT